VALRLVTGPACSVFVSDVPFSFFAGPALGLLTFLDLMPDQFGKDPSSVG